MIFIISTRKKRDRPKILGNQAIATDPNLVGNRGGGLTPSAIPRIRKPVYRLPRAMRARREQRGDLRHDPTRVRIIGRVRPNVAFLGNEKGIPDATGGHEPQMARPQRANRRPHRPRRMRRPSDDEVPRRLGHGESRIATPSPAQQIHLLTGPDRQDANRHRCRRDAHELQHRARDIDLQNRPTPARARASARQPRHQKRENILLALGQCRRNRGVRPSAFRFARSHDRTERNVVSRPPLTRGEKRTWARPNWTRPRILPKF